MQISRANFHAVDFQALLDLHLAEAHQDDCGAALGRSELQADDMIMFEARGTEGVLLGFAALKALSPTHGEIKSVRTHPDHLRKGVSRALMLRLTEIAKTNGLTRLSLETHPTAAYAAARALYEKLGYQYCSAFGNYVDGDKYVFMTQEI